MWDGSQVFAGRDKVKRAERFAFVRLVASNGTTLESKNCTDRWEAETIAKDFAAKSIGNIAYVLDVVAAYVAEPRVEPAMLFYPEKPAETPVEEVVSPPALSGIAVMEDF